MDFQYHPFTSKRNTVFAKKGMVATSQPLAAQAGLEILKKGGNAIDAAIATAAALTVVEPTSNGIGGDAFALVWMKDELHGINGSGPSPKNISIEKVKEQGNESMPVYGVTPVTVPGAPATWAALSEKFGKLPFHELFEPAIRYAEEGYPISPTLGKFWGSAYAKFKKIYTTDEFKPWFDVFSLNDEAPKVGDVWKSPDHANTLRLIAQSKAEAFYKGEIADKIHDFMQLHNGFLTREDLAEYQPEWVQPISTNYKGYDVWEIPPNGQGLVALMALNIYKQLDEPSWMNTETYHQQIESMKLAYTDGKSYITETDDMPAHVDFFLADDYAKERAALVTSSALTPTPMDIPKGGTVYLATADEEGNMVSFIQSNYMGFGSGIVVPGTGVALQNRGHDFSLDETHPNALKPGKRTYHTIIPGFLTKDGQAVGPFGVMGGYMQPQGHFQVVTNTVDFLLNPQAALDMPRWQWIKDKTVMVEPEFPNHIAQSLARKGHDIQVTVDGGSFGRGQIIWRNAETGVLMGGTESRTDGAVAAW